MDIENDWRREYLCGLYAWVRDLALLSPESERLRLAVWYGKGQCEWEWEVINELTDRHILGAVSMSCHSAKQAAEKAAAALALSEPLFDVVSQDIRPPEPNQ